MPFRLTAESLSFFQEIKELEILHFTQFEKIKPKNYAGNTEFVPVVKDFFIHSKYDQKIIPVRFFKPSMHALHPIIIYGHGGGFVYGSLDSHDALCRRLALRTNCSVLAVDYSLAPQYKFPAAINDFHSVYNWVFSNKKDFNVLNNSIIFAGDSSGANIATATTCRLIKEGAFLPLSLILITPVLDLSFSSKSDNDLDTSYLLTKEILQSYRDQYTKSYDNLSHWMLSPIFFDELEHFPSTLVITAGCDFLCNEAKLFTDKIKAKGGKTKYVSFPGILHGFINCHGCIPEAEQVLNVIKKYLRGITNGNN